MWFEALSDMKINLNKSEVIQIGTVDNVEELASELGCKVGSLPTPYLGLPLGAKHKALGVWDSIEERFRKRLAPWKIQYISKGGGGYAHSYHLIQPSNLLSLSLSYAPKSECQIGKDSQTVSLGRE